MVILLRRAPALRGPLGQSGVPAARVVVEAPSTGYLPHHHLDHDHDPPAQGARVRNRAKLRRLRGRRQGGAHLQCGSGDCGDGDGDGGEYFTYDIFPSVPVMDSLDAME